MAPLRAVFVGENANGAATLWVTDGTDIGTVNFATGAGYSELVSANVNPDFTLLGHELLFIGADASGDTNLWVTDGTTVDTSEITVSGVSSVLSPNLNPDFTVFGNDVLFVGYGSNGYPGVWVTNGTAAGMTELSVVGAANNNGFYGSFADFTVLGNEVLFVDTTKNGDGELWVTDGTTAGTTQIQVTGTASSFLGYQNPDFTIIGGKALLVGDDNNGRASLWVTGGTSAGTSELSAAVSNVNNSGLFWDYLKPDFTVLGSMALFEGLDSSNKYNPWVTNGTAAGTFELYVAGAYSGGAIFPANSSNSSSVGPDFTVFGNQAVFLSLNASDVLGIAITNGTEAGTSELSVGGAYSGGLFDWSTSPNPEFTALGNEVLFEGEDQSGHLGLWVTNGTVLGTSELTGIANAYSGGLFASGVNPDLTANGNVALFDGYDSSGHLQLWVTNGTAAGTSEVVAAGAGSGGLNPTDFAFLPISSQPAPDDFTGNGISDILWQNTDGQAAIWLMNGTTPTSEAVAGPNPGPNWKVIGSTGDFTDNGKSDILWQNTDGQAAIWLMNGATPTTKPRSGRILGRAGTWSGRAISTATANPTCCGRTPTAKRPSG